MLGLFSKIPESGERQSKHLFSEDDLREIFTAFTLEDAGVEQKLIRTSVAADLINRTQLVESIKKDACNDSSNRLLLTSLAAEYHVQESTIRNIIALHPGWAFETADGQSILTTSAQQRLLENLYAKTNKTFEVLSVFLHDITLPVLINLLESREQSLPLCYGDRHGSPALKEAGIEIYSAGLFDKVKWKVEAFIQDSQETAE
jgi:hypothetical protein